jgi:hypothetical protein
LSLLLIISLLFPSSFQVVRTRETTFVSALKNSISLPNFFYPATPYCPCMCHVDYDVLAIPLVTLFLSLCTMLFSCLGFLFFWCICMKFILHMNFFMWNLLLWLHSVIGWGLFCPPAATRLGGSRRMNSLFWIITREGDVRYVSSHQGRLIIFIMLWCDLGCAHSKWALHGMETSNWQNCFDTKTATFILSLSLTQLSTMLLGLGMPLCTHL